MFQNILGWWKVNLASCDVPHQQDQTVRTKANH